MMVDWIDRDTNPQTQGAEDSLYLGQNPPYLAANQYITSITELLALPGFGRENYEKLAPYIAALPPVTTLNICTAKDKVLDAFNAGSREWSSDRGRRYRRTAPTHPAAFPTDDRLPANLRRPGEVHRRGGHVRHELPILPPVQPGHYWHRGIQLVQSSTHGHTRLFYSPDPAQLLAGLSTHEGTRTWLIGC